jgi:REP element-mobilizing transposase RayT
MELLRQSMELHHASLLGYCLMSNHVHLIVTPTQGDSLGRALKDTHGRFASYWHARRHTSGHVWQERRAYRSLGAGIGHSDKVILAALHVYGGVHGTHHQGNA